MIDRAVSTTTAILIVAYTRVEWAALVGVLIIATAAAFGGWEAFQAQRTLDRRLDQQALAIGAVRKDVAAVRREVAKIPKA